MATESREAETQSLSRGAAMTRIGSGATTMSTARPVGFPQLAGDADRPGVALTENLGKEAKVSQEHPINQVKVSLRVHVGSATLRVKDLLSMEKDRVLCLDRTFEDPVDILLENAVIARGHLVAVGDHFAVRISEKPLPVNLPQATDA